jgi:hypothetical protein
MLTSPVHQVASEAQEQSRSSLHVVRPRRVLVLEARCVAAAGGPETRSDGGFGIIPARRSTRKIEEVSPAAMPTVRTKLFTQSSSILNHVSALRAVVRCFWHFILTKLINRKQTNKPTSSSSNLKQRRITFLFSTPVSGRTVRYSVLPRV